MKKVVFTILLISFLTSFVYSQNPTDGCPAQMLTVETECRSIAFSLSGAYADGGLVSASCRVTNRDDGWYSFVATSTSTTINANGSRAFNLAVFTACGGGSELGCNYVNGTTATVTVATSIGVTYYVQIHRNGGTNGQGMTGNICIYETPPTATNDDCANAISLPCGTLDMQGYTVSSVSQVHGTGCTMGQYGAWYTFVGDGNNNVIFATPVGGIYDIEMAVASGSCGSLTNVSCQDAGLAGEGEGVSFVTTLGVTYYVYISHWLSTSTETGFFTVSRTCTDNDICADATTLSCGSTLLGSTIGATSVAHGTGCTMGPEGAWYTFMGDGIPTTIQAQQYTSFDFEMAIVSGSCGAKTNVTCVDLFTNTETYTFTPTNGVRYYIYIADWFSGGGLSGAFTIARTCGNPCGNDVTNDYCSNPAQLFQGGGGWSSSTTSTFTPDFPANTSGLFCGSIENNSWYEFTASATTEVFNFTNVTNCGYGIQAQVFNVTRNASGCCTNLSSVSNCMSAGNTNPGTVTATGLTIGQNYVLMVDGFAAANCDFSVTNWTASGILPVKLLYFDGQRVGESTKLYWSTASEVNNDYFLVQKSSNGKNFIDIGTIKGHGNSNVVNSYEFMDNSSSPQLAYYRLKQFDFNGAYEFSKIIAIASENADIDIVIYPNPAETKLFVDISSKNQQVFTVKYINLLGSVSSEKIDVSSEFNTYLLNNFKQLNSGLYILQFYDNQNNLVKSEKVVKQ